MSWLDAVASEGDVERVGPSSEFLNPTLDTISATVREDAVTDTDPAEGRSASHRPVGDRYLREVTVEILDFFEKPPCREVVSRRRDAQMNDLARFRIGRGEQHELLAALAHGSLVQQECRGKIGNGLATRRRESVAELLDPVPDGDMRTLDTDPA